MSLHDGDIVTQPALGRRSAFLGLGAAAVASVMLPPNQAEAQGYNDNDPSDPAGQGRRGRPMITDRDTGPARDPMLGGRGMQRGTIPGISDADARPNADPAGRGRGKQNPPQPAQQAAPQRATQRPAQRPPGPTAQPQQQRTPQRPAGQTASQPPRITDF